MTTSRGRGKPKRRRDTEIPPKDVYEAEDSDPEEDKLAGKRYDVVDSYEYELPNDFQDEEIDEDAAFNSEDERLYGHLFQDEEGGQQEDDDEEEDAFAALESSEEEDELDEVFGAHDDVDSEDEQDDDDDDEEAKRLNMVQALTKTEKSRGAPKEDVITEAYAESLTRLPDSGLVKDLTIEGLISGLGDKSGSLGAARKALEKLERKANAIPAPLPGPIKERQERISGYDAAVEDIAKWVPLVKAHREAPTLRFKADTASIPKTNTTASLAAKHGPETNMEKEIAALLETSGTQTADAVMAMEDELAAKQLSIIEATERRERLAKMRALLFYHEQKAKRLKKIKSKEYRRRMKRAQQKREPDQLLGLETDGKSEREAAELERAKERMTLKHKNTSRFIRRALKRGQNAMDVGMRQTVAEQLNIGQELRQRIRTMKDDDSESESGSEEVNENSQVEEEELPTKGLFALPFMKRAMERRNAEVHAFLDTEKVETGRFSSASKKSSAKRPPLNDPIRDTKTFIPSDTFGGPKPGFSFKQGEKGLGYYCEDNQPKKKKKDKKAKAPPLDMSQQDLIRAAFAGDDVTADFEAVKASEVEAEIDIKEGIQDLGGLPGWGGWASSQREPKWLVEAKTKAAARRAKTAASRKDANLQGVVLSEKADRRGSKYRITSVPFPFDSKESYEGAMRQPLGRDFNTLASFRDLTRPSVVKDVGVIIEPARYSQVVGEHNVKGTGAKRAGVITVQGGMPKKTKRVTDL